MTRSPRTATRLNPKTNAKLTAYVAAASAAGVAMIAATPSAEAKIVYTPANQILSFGTHAQIPFDINGDGIPDIVFTGGTLGYGAYMGVGPAAGNGIVGAPSSAAALPWGARVGPKDQFMDKWELMDEQAGCHATCSTFGPWAGKRNRFLGVRFLINGQTHYGWVNIQTGKITGSGYETVPNQPILAGDKSGPVQVAAAAPAQLLAPSKQPATLDMLAAGADRLELWRRKEQTSIEG